MARLATALGVVALITAACGGESDTRSAAPTTTSTAPVCPGGALPDAVNDHGTAAASGASVTVSVGDSFFAPTCATKVPTGTVAVALANTGQALHNFSVPDQGIDNDVAPGQTVTVSVTVGSGPLRFFCKYHRTSGMVGALVPG